MRLKTVHIVVVVLVFIGAILAYESLSSDIAPYLSVSNITNDSSVHVGKNVKVLGRVANVSSGRSKEGYNFELNDGKATIAVTYTGSLSQSLKKGQEVGVIGVQDTPDHVTASQLDIKCASKYE
ncbi:MAG: cytochrome c maturation protein CcmE [Halobacteriota archaeon]